MHRFARAARMLAFELADTMDEYAHNYGEMTPEEWATGDWFVEGHEDGREDWIER